MYQRLQKWIILHLSRKGITDDDHIYVYLISFIALCFCAVIHSYLLVAFLVHKVPLFFWLNVCSLLIYSLLFLLHKKEKYIALILILSLEVTIYASITTLLTGISSYIMGYFLLAMILQIILPYTSIKTRSIVVFSILCTASVCLVYATQQQPSIVLSPSLQSLLLVSNVYILLIGTPLQVYVGNIVRRIINHYNSIRFEVMERLANTDPLTGLYNRRFAEEHLLNILHSKASVPYCVAMLDIDDFKVVNDTYGHDCGDEVLVFLSNFLRTSLRKTDVIFRWGGEEILIVLEDTLPDVAESILEKFRIRLAESVISTAAAPIRITVSIGVTTLDLENPMESIRISDECLYMAKRNGKNCVVSHHSK